MEFLRGFDIIIIQETWVDEMGAKKAIRKLSKDYKYWVKGAEKKNKMSKRGRLAGGQIVGIRKTLQEGWKVCEWAFGLVLEYKQEMCIITVYNNVSMAIIEEDLKGEIEKAVREFDEIIICGDMNARVGKNQMCVEVDEEETYQKVRN